MPTKTVARPSIGRQANELANHDVLWGAAAIAGFMSEFCDGPITRNMVYKLVTSRDLPATRLGSRVIASKKKIREHLEGLLDGAIAPREPRAPAPLSRPRRAARARRAR
jgi:hypothetical protein